MLRHFDEITEERGQEIARVEEALQAYARRHGYIVMVGSQMEAVIDVREVLALPRPAPPNAQSSRRPYGAQDSGTNWPRSTWTSCAGR